MSNLYSVYSKNTGRRTWQARDYSQQPHIMLALHTFNKTTRMILAGRNTEGTWTYKAAQFSAKTNNESIRSALSSVLDVVNRPCRVSIIIDQTVDNVMPTLVDFRAWTGVQGSNANKHMLRVEVNASRVLAAISKVA